jgi:hypothetical protein
MLLLTTLATVQVYLQAIDSRGAGRREPEITEEWEMNQWGEYELVRAYVEEDLSHLPNTNPQSYQPWYDEF